jgi:hypothetical protein
VTRGVGAQNAPARREATAVHQPADICAVCQRSRVRGARNLAGDVFICTECQADAKQIMEIQDSIWTADADQLNGEAGDTAQP